MQYQLKFQKAILWTNYNTQPHVLQWQKQNRQYQGLVMTVPLRGLNFTLCKMYHYTGLKILLGPSLAMGEEKWPWSWAVCRGKPFRRWKWPWNLQRSIWCGNANDYQDGWKIFLRVSRNFLERRTAEEKTVLCVNLPRRGSELLWFEQ